MSAQMMRYMILYFINLAASGEGDNYCLLGKGFTKLDESPNPQVESKTYIHEKTATPTIKSYEPSFPFEAELWRGEAGLTKLYEIARNRKVGSDAVVEIVATDFLADETGAAVASPTARKMQMAVEVSDLVTGEGGEVLTMSGNLNQIGEAEEGWFTVATKTWSSTNPNSN